MAMRFYLFKMDFSIAHNYSSLREGRSPMKPDSDSDGFVWNGIRYLFHKTIVILSIIYTFFGTNTNGDGVGMGGWGMDLVSFQENFGEFRVDAVFFS